MNSPRTRDAKINVLRLSHRPACDQPHGTPSQSATIFQAIVTRKLFFIFLSLQRTTVKFPSTTNISYNISNINIF
ncbi:unnamed protein product [Rhizophagus irregularis]|uniref:Uncharacterized protein n=1 Tax=Rhizophagus irregularis TaxID=588596 RepID=A0A915ZFJ6_9GLOM|nr:unnamed protein product [Rhizophagus irregularis]CAB5374538.1 unnamed protein product [Rhizophagus irregularis]